jgi:co-chaperonin GroES (HSP10)
MDLSTDQFIVVGDRILVKPKSADERTNSGLYLPPGVQEKEKIRSGYVIKSGPGYAFPHASEDEPWKEASEKVRYVPLQAQPGDLAIFLQDMAHEIEFNKEKYIIVPQSAILLLIRDEGLFE